MILQVADTIGRIIEFWGFKRAMGRMWTLLYLHPEPLSAQDLGEGLSMSAGGVSTTLQELVRWGVIKRTWRPGERREYYEPETSIWNMVSRVMQERELREVRSAIESMTEAIEHLRDLLRAAEDKKRLKFVLSRTESLLALAKIGEALIQSLVAGQKINTVPIKSFAVKS